jgi:hypothetical protein
MEITVTQTEYSAMPGTRFTDKDARIIGPEIERLANEGRSTAAGVVDAARMKEAPLHPYFEWNNDVAAERFRESQARRMIGAIKVKVVDMRGVEREGRGFEPVNLVVQTSKQEDEQEKPEPKHYVQVQVIQQRPDLSAQVLREVEQRLQSARRKFNEYKHIFPSETVTEYSPVMQAIEGLRLVQSR